MLIISPSLAASGPLAHFEYLASSLQGADLALFLLINMGMSNVILDRTMPWITQLGGFWAGWIFVLALAALMGKGKPVEQKIRSGVYLALIYGSVSAFQFFVKHLAGRPRPYIDHEVIVRTALPADPSFPSGHAATAFMMAVILSSQFPRYRYIFYALAALIGLSRVYLGVHYPGDVIAGALIGYGIARLLLSSRLFGLSAILCG